MASEQFLYNFTCHQTEGNPNALGPFSNMSLRASAQKLSRLPLVDFHCLKECLPSMSPCNYPQSWVSVQGWQGCQLLGKQNEFKRLAL